jgi:hypothetical protein
MRASDFQLANQDAFEYNQPITGNAIFAILVGNPMLRFFGKMSAAHGRFWLYALAFPCAFALDTVTSLAIADWLIEMILVWIASVWGDPQEVGLVAAVGSATVIAGLWSSPADVPLWMGILNRFVAIAVMWTMVYVANGRHAAEQAQPKSAPRSRLLPDLLPICASCKAIRSESGEWFPLEYYISANAGVRFTHGLCPPCAAKYGEGLRTAP